MTFDYRSRRGDWLGALAAALGFGFVGWIIGGATGFVALGALTGVLAGWAVPGRQDSAGPRETGDARQRPPRNPPMKAA